jgi:quercetin dioxygenase-like cupin family protein
MFRSRFRRALLVLAVLASGVLIAGVLSGTAPATPGSGAVSTQLARGTVADAINLNERLAQGQHLRIHTEASIDVATYKVDLAPGGTTGWHSHPGPSFNVVAEGEVTYYTEGTSCTPHRYPAGTTFVNPSKIVHTLRNEGTVPAVVYVTWMVPVGANPIRVDEPAPGNCPF